MYALLFHSNHLPEQIIGVDLADNFDWSTSVVVFLEVISSINVNW